MFLEVVSHQLALLQESVITKPVLLTQPEEVDLSPVIQDTLERLITLAPHLVRRLLREVVLQLAPFRLQWVQTPLL